MKRFIAILSGFMVTVMLSACGGAAVSTTSTQTETAISTNAATTTATPTEVAKQIHIGYAAAGLSSEYNMMVHSELQAACDKENVKLDTLSCEGDVSLQVQQVENFITMGVDKIIIYPVDPKAIKDVLIKARKAGIYVVDCDQIADKEAYDVALSVNMHDLGVACAKSAAAWIDKTFPDAKPGTVKCAVLGFWYTETFGERCDVMLDIAKYTDKAVIVEKYDTGLDNYATTVGQNAQLLMQKHPDINVVMSFTDTFAIIADEVIMQNKSKIDFNKIAQFTVDRTTNGFERIKKSQTNESSIRGTVVPGFYIAQDLLDAALGRLDKSLFNADNIYFEKIQAVTADNIDELTKK